MKRMIKLAVYCLSAFAFVACGNNKITVTGENGKTYESYQECCAANDYEAAHQYLVKMKNAAAQKDDNRYEAEKEYNSAKEEVFKQEALFLMGLGDETAQKRIIYLLKEDGAEVIGNSRFNQRVSMLIDLAIENDDENFVKSLGNQYRGDGDIHGLKTICEYLFSKDSPDNVQYIGALLKKTGNERLYLDIAIKNNDQEFINEYATNHMSFSETSLLNYLAGLNNKDKSEKIIALLTKSENTIAKKPQLGVNHLGNNDERDDFIKDCDRYSSNVESHNSKCRDILSIAIKNKNLYLAQRAVSKAKGNISHEQHSRGYCYIQVNADNNDINALKSSLQESIRSGAFK